MVALFLLVNTIYQSFSHWLDNPLQLSGFERFGCVFSIMKKKKPSGIIMSKYHNPSKTRLSARADCCSGAGSVAKWIRGLLRGTMIWWEHLYWQPVDAAASASAKRSPVMQKRNKKKKEKEWMWPELKSISRWPAWSSCLLVGVLLYSFTLTIQCWWWECLARLA